MFQENREGRGKEFNRNHTKKSPRTEKLKSPNAKDWVSRWWLKKIPSHIIMKFNYSRDQEEDIIKIGKKYRPQINGWKLERPQTVPKQHRIQWKSASTRENDFQPRVLHRTKPSILCESRIKHLKLENLLHKYCFFERMGDGKGTFKMRGVQQEWG